MTTDTPIISAFMSDWNAEQRELDLQMRTNIFRASRSVGPLRFDPRLHEVAKARVQDMIARKWYGHKDPQGVGINTLLLQAGLLYSSWGENIGWGFKEGQQILDAFIASPTHLWNLERSVYTFQAVGCQLDTVGGTYQNTKDGGSNYFGPNNYFWCCIYFLPRS